MPDAMSIILLVAVASMMIQWKNHVQLRRAVIEQMLAVVRQNTDAIKAVKKAVDHNTDLIGQ